MNKETLRSCLTRNARQATSTFEPPAPVLNPESYAAEIYKHHMTQFNPFLFGELVEEMRRDEELKLFDGGEIVLGSAGFRTDLYKLAEWLIAQSLMNGPDQALDRLEAFLELDYAPAYEVLALCGVTIDRQIELRDGIRLVPFTEVPRSAVTDWLTGTPTWITSDLGRIPRSIIPKAALIADLQQKPKMLANFSEPSQSTPRATKLPQMERIAMCLSIVGPSCPTALAHWIHLRDDVPLAWYVESWAEMTNEQLPRESVDLSEASDTIRKVIDFYLRLPSHMQEQLSVPLSRLNKSCKRLDLIDRAIELRIAFESLLANKLDENAPIAYSLRLRGAFLAAKTSPERLRIYKLIGDVYALGSRAVHRGHLGRKTENAASLLNQGGQLCADLILTIMERGEFPDWDSLIVG